VDVFFAHNSIRWQKLKCCVVKKVALPENCVEGDLILSVQILRNDCFDYVSSPSAQIVLKKCCSCKGKGCVGYIAPTILAKPKIMAST
jgi:hypothetical protein